MPIFGHTHQILYGQITAKIHQNCPYLSSRYSNNKQLTSFKIIELDRVSLFFHEIFRINVELNLDFEFWSGILS